MRSDPARAAVQRQLPYGYPHAVHPEVTEPENARAVRHDDDVDLSSPKTL